MCSHDDNGLCASLPVGIRAISLVHCEVHQSYTLHVSRSVQRGDDQIESEHATIEFGPFDSWYEIESGCRQALEDLLR